MEKNEIVIFETEDKEVKLPVTVEDETVWLNQNQMIELFGRDQSVISRHIRNAMRLMKKAICIFCILQIQISR